MFFLEQNRVILIKENSFTYHYRVVADNPKYPHAYLIRLKNSEEENKQSNETSSLLLFERSHLIELVNSEKLQKVNLPSSGKHIQHQEKLSEKELNILRYREKIMSNFLNSQELTKCLYLTNSVSPLVKQAVIDNGCSKATVYKLFKLLCEFGFGSGSLNPRFDKCGAPGIHRPVGVNQRKVGRKTNYERFNAGDAFSQPGCSQEWRQKVIEADSKIPAPKPKFNYRYLTILKEFSPGYQQTENGIQRIPPKRGTCPNKRQVRYILKKYSQIERAKEVTTPGHFKRNRRGLTGRSWESVAGPGHQYCMDSTLGDIYLRSQINRAWIIGRPIVYFLVDVWSTAIVGFHVCLSGPSWDMAKLGIFSAIAPSDLAVKLDNLKPVSDSLFPRPGIPHVIHGDRGEYLSQGAIETGSLLGFNFDISASYRPDMKGLVEVQHRILKDKQYEFKPGAMDARKKEIELRVNKNDSIHTLPEYIKFISDFIKHQNENADRSHRLDTSMISAGVKPSPAGLWRYGFEAGIGFSKHIEPEKICTHLLKPYQGTIRRDGIFMEGLEYKLALADREEWTTLARHSGAIPITMHLHPCQLEKAWIYDDQKHGLLELTLSDEARTKGKNSIYEYLDAVTRESFSRSEREHKTTKANFEFNEQNENDVKKAKALTKKAEKNFIGEKPPIKEARRLEIDAIAKDSFVSKTSSERPLKQITGETIHSQEPAPNNPLIKKLFDSVLGEEK